MKTIWYILVIAIVIIAKSDEDVNANATAGTQATEEEPKVPGQDMNLTDATTTSTTEKMEHTNTPGVPQVTGPVKVAPTSTSSSSGLPVTDPQKIFPTESTSPMAQADENAPGLTSEDPSSTDGSSEAPSTAQTITTKSKSSTSASNPISSVDSLTTSTTSVPPTQSTSSSITSETTTTESSSAKNPKCCCCTNCEEVAVKPTPTNSSTNGGIVATGSNLAVKGINKSPVMAIIITVSFLALVTFMSFCYRRRGDISMKVRTWSIRARQFDFNSLRPVCLRWKKPNSESSPILVFKVDESELDVLTENMV